jgi:hypothetical protein
MDDGHRRDKSCEMGTYGFGYQGNLDILKYLNSKFGLTAKISQNQKDGRSIDKCYYIDFNVAEADKFFQLVAPHILPHFQYKLPERLRTI